LFQTYYNEIRNPDIAVDGIAGNESLTVITNNVKLTQIFLRELGALETSGPKPNQPL
jgi:hypothetical protein